MIQREKVLISGIEDGHRIESRILEERLQNAVKNGYQDIEVQAFGQHGIGGRLWKTPDTLIKISISGQAGQRVGAMGSPNTFIEVHGPASDDVGWLNAGAKIVVHGDATNGIGNAMAQGKIYIAGDIGARGMTMTKSNPKYAPPELWVLGGVGDSFAEFMAGGIAVVCGLGSHYRGNILGHRPCVGMVGGKIFFRGTQKNFSEEDARLKRISDEEWEWLTANMKEFLNAIERPDLYDTVTSDRSTWQLLTALKPSEKIKNERFPMSRFKTDIWDKELGTGGLIGDLTDIDRSLIPVIVTGDLRRFVPVWENQKYLPPCQAYCPIGIPVQKRWELIRKGEIDQAVDLALEYSPFPATVCGYLCPNICMNHCTRGQELLKPVDITVLGKASLNAHDPEHAPNTGKKIAVIGGGPAGLSVAWQLWLKGHEPVVYDIKDKPGGKVETVIPHSRIPKEVFEQELTRIKQKITYKKLEHDLTEKDFLSIRDAYDFTVIAVGARTPRMLKVNGHKMVYSALEFLQHAKSNKLKVGKRVVVIGAGNVGCDVATEAKRLGAEDITLIDIQKPASFGTERKAAEEAGAKFLWPVFTKEITKKGIELTNGEIIPADTVVISIGDQPDLKFLPASIDSLGGFVKVNDVYQTTDPKVFAIGDSVRLGLLADAIGTGRKVANTIDSRLKGEEETFDRLPVIDTDRIKLEYYDPGLQENNDITQCATQCASCGGCRDCGVCVTICPQRAISRRDLQQGNYEYVVNDELCIGCGFCGSACPCGIWRIKENTPIE